MCCSAAYSLWAVLGRDDPDIVSFFDMGVVKVLLNALLDQSAQTAIMGCLQALSYTRDGRDAIMVSQAVKGILPFVYGMKPKVMSLLSIMLSQLFQNGMCLDILCSREGCHFLLFMSHRLVVEAIQLFCCCVVEINKNPPSTFEVIDADNLATLFRLLSCEDVMVSTPSNDMQKAVLTTGII